MTDSSLPRSSRWRPKQGTICESCSCNSKEQDRCIFNKVNVLGITAGFSPSEKYRRQHRDDIAGSPLMQGFRNPKPIDWGVPLDSMVLPKVKMPYFPVQSMQSMMNTLNRMRVIRKQIGAQ